jgi:ferredoxin, 2Fe-2S
MPRLIVVTRTGEERSFEANPSSSVMEAIRDSGIDDIAAICGGCCSCATCHVHVDPAHVAGLPARSEDEYSLLHELESFKDNSRLSCQIRMTDAIEGFKVTIAPEE